MATQYTSLLGLALPVTGELSGTWGDTVNDSITSLLDTAVAGTTSLTTDTDVTLTTTTGASNQARQAIILWAPASGTTTRNITAPAQSKIYTVINASGGTQSIVFRGAGPTTGVTIVKGEAAIVAWNGSDFIKVSNTGGSASFTNVTVTGTTTLSALTASTALALDSSKNVVSVTNTGTGNNVLSASPTLTGTVAGASLQLSSLTATRVTYAGASGLLTDSANMTFNGTRLTVADLADSGLTSGRVTYASTGGALVDSANLTFDGTTLVASNLTDSSLTSGRVTYATTGGNLTDSANLTFNGTDLTVSGAVNAGTINATTLDLTNIEVTNIKAKDGTASITLADSTGVASFTANPVLSGGTANGVAYLNGSKVLTTGSALTFDGTNLNFGGTAQRITGDFSNATLANRVFFQTSTTNGASVVGVLPNGTGTITQLAVYGGSDPANAQVFRFDVRGGSESRIESTFAGTPSSGTFLPMTFYTNGSEQMRLTSTGLGIGTSSPAEKLDVYVNSTANISAKVGNTSGAVQLLQSNGIAYLYTASNQPIAFSTNNSEQMRLTSTGLGIGTSSPAVKLEVAGDARLTGANPSLSAVPSSTGFFIDNRGVGKSTFFRVSSASAIDTTAATLDSSGNLGLGVTPSAWGGSYRSLDILTSGASFAGSVNAAYMATAAFNNNSNWIYRSSTLRPVLYTQFDSGHYWYTAPSGTAGNAISFTQAMTLDASGQLAIGTTSATSKLTVGGSGANRISFAAPAGTQYVGYDGGTDALQIASINSIIFQAGGYTERARIDSSGNLLIGTTSGSERLRVSATNNAAGFLNTTAASATAFSWNQATSGNNIFYDFGTEASFTSRGSITYNRGAGLVAYNTTSDYRAKDIIGPIQDSGAVIDSVPVYMGKMKGATQERPMFIAHETPAYAHTGEKDAVDADGNPIFQQMDASALIPVMWAEIQSLRARVAYLEAK